MVTYQVELKFDFARDGTYIHAQADMTPRLIMLQTSYGMQDPYQTVSPAATLALTFTNRDGAFNVNDPTAALYGLLNPGILVRLRVAIDGTWHTRFIGHTTASTRYVVGKHETQKQVLVTVTDPVNRLYNDVYIPPLETNVTTNTPLVTMFDKPVITWPYDRSFFMLDASELDGADGLFDAPNTIYSFETGLTTLDYSGDVGDLGGGMSPLNFITQMVTSECGGRFYWDPHQAKFIFHNRHHDVLNQETITATFTMADLLGYTFGQTPVINDVTIQYEPRQLGTPSSIIYASDSVPFRLRSGEIRTMSVRYRDPTIDTTIISAINVIAPVRGVDVIANELSGGGGADRTSVVGYTSNSGGQSAALTLTNSSSVDVYITTLQLRGTPLSRRNGEQVRAVDPTSIRAYQRSPLPPETIPGLNDADMAADYARLLVNRFKTPTGAFTSVTVRANDNGVLLTTSFSIDLMEQIALTNDWTRHDAQYVVMGIQEQWDAPSAIWDITYLLKPFALENIFRIDYSELDASDGLAF